MPTITSIALTDAQAATVPDRGEGPVMWNRAWTISSTLADNGDDITLFSLPPYRQIVGGSWEVSATLGASCTATLRVGSTAITAASTAGGADSDPVIRVVAPSASAQTVNILIGGADISAGATITTHLLIAPATV